MDPAVGLTLAPYSYGNDDHVNSSDPSGMISCGGWLGWVPGTVTDIQNGVSGAAKEGAHLTIDAATCVVRILKASRSA